MNSRILSRYIKNSVVALVSAVVLSGCVVSATPHSNTPSKEAGASGSKLCVINNSSLNAKIRWRGYPTEQQLPPGGQSCNSGYENGKPDVSAVLQYEPISSPGTWFTWRASLDNTWFFGQHAKLGLGYLAQGSFYGLCEVLDIGESASMQADWLHAEAIRLPDTSENAEYVVTLNDSTGGNIAYVAGKCRFS